MTRSAWLPLILASTSPRRAQLLQEAGYDFRVIPPAFDDSGFDAAGLSVEQTVIELARRKAESVGAPAQRGIVIGCDTLLSLDGKPIGKPADAQEARRILMLLMGRSHRVLTAVCLLPLPAGPSKAFIEAAQVTIHPLTPAALDEYLRSGRWRGKAGGYNLAELQGAWTFEVRGDPTTVIGLPMKRLKRELGLIAADQHG